MIPQSISLSIDWDNACLQFQGTGWDGNVYSTVVYKQEMVLKESIPLLEEQIKFPSVRAW